MRAFNFTLAFSVMADHELDARVKLKELLKSISKEEILWAMQIVDEDYGDDSDHIDPSLWDDYYTAFDTLVEYGMREPRRKR
jgi:hypothetical protein